ncbi:MAG: hypothetical protein L6R28_21520 [Planctomycetes bacterium]|nr:hypothetical protein [Planctomycetota bacterium]
MPIEYRIEHERRLVIATGSGSVTHMDIMTYQRACWTRGDVQGYDELVDFTAVRELGPSSVESVREIAEVAVTMDPPEGGSKFAIVAPDDLAFALGRMYEVYREMVPGSKKEVAVFHTLEEAFAWLGKETE